MDVHDRVNCRDEASTGRVNRKIILLRNPVCMQKYSHYEKQLKLRMSVAVRVMPDITKY